jgi:hypothetical protein
MNLVRLDLVTYMSLFVICKTRYIHEFICNLQDESCEASYFMIGQYLSNTKKMLHCPFYKKKSATKQGPEIYINMYDIKLVLLNLP